MIQKIANLLRFDKELILAKNLGWAQKFSFIVRKYVSVFLNSRKINYLGRDFYYDGRFSAVPLQMYPREIAFLDDNIKLNQIGSVLDIGANVGQFAFTIKSLFPKIQIFSFEPNKEIFILKKNLGYFDKVRLFNFGVGGKGKRKFYYSPSSSGLGSFYKENVHQFGRKEDLKEIQVEITPLGKSEIKKLKLPQKFDLIKIDVEGAEVEVLKSLKGVECRYIFLEVSANRTGVVGLSEITKLLQEIFNKPVCLIGSRRLSSNSPSMDCLFRLD